MRRDKKFKKRLNRFKNTRYYQIQDKIFEYFGVFCTFIGIVVLASLLFDIFSKGFSRLDVNFLFNFTSTRISKVSTAGIYSAWVGTLWMMFLTAVIAFPIGVGAGVYLEEYNKKGKLANFIEINISNLAGIPSVIYGLLGLEIFARAMMLGPSLLAGALTLALLILPIIIVSTRETLKMVPQTIREASYALGASKWQTVWHQVIPASLSGIITGVILAISRAIGETAPLIVVGALMYVPYLPQNPLDSYTVLPMQIYHWISLPQKEFAVNAAAAIIVLLSITFILNGTAVYIRHRWQKKIKW